MATLLFAVCSDYATLEDAVLTPGAVPCARVVYVNPAYAVADQKNGAAGIECHLGKLIEVDVRQRGCTLIALLPNLSHTVWHERLVGAAHEIYNIRGALTFPNPFTDVGQITKGYLWESRAYVLCLWRPSPLPPRSQRSRISLWMRYRRSTLNCAPANCAGGCASCLGGRTHAVTRSRRDALCVRARRMPNTMIVRSQSYCCTLWSDVNTTTRIFTWTCTCVGMQMCTD